jgi:uncharacterized small protein (DUF1192 family)
LIRSAVFGATATPRTEFSTDSLGAVDARPRAPWHSGAGYAILGFTRTVQSGEQQMTGPTIAELDERIAAIRQNINDLVEQAAAYSGAGDESRTADRIAQQEQELARLTAQRDALRNQ